MIIGVISYVSNYKELFQSDENVEVALLADRVQKDQFNVPLNLLVLDGKVIPYTELAHVRDVYPNIPIYYKLHDVRSDILTKNIERVCAAHKVTPVNENYTTEQVVAELLETIGSEREYASKRVISIFGTHGGAGASTTVLNVADSISKRVQEKVLVLSLNAWDQSDYFYNYRGKYLNDLKVDLKTKSLTVPKLNEALHQHNNFYHLAGNRDIKLQRFYKADEINHLIEVAKEGFNLILIDGGTHFDTACAAQAYVSSNLRFLVTSQEEKGYRGYFPHVFQQLIEPVGGKKSDFLLVINKFQQNMSLISENDLEAELEMQRIATLPDMEIFGSVAIRQKKLLYEITEGSGYRKAIDNISNLIIKEAKLHEKPIDYNPDEQPRRIFSIFGKKKGKEEGEKIW